MDTEEKGFYKTPFGKFFAGFYAIFDGPVTWFRESVVLPNRQEYYWYHEKLRRVPTVDECYTDDLVCMYEADEQYKRDRSVDENIVHILRKRFERCTFDNRDELSECDEIREYWENAMTNYFIKYGDLGMSHNALKCYMKQKHRMAWERRHGPVGSGKKPEKIELPQKKEDTC